MNDAKILEYLNNSTVNYARTQKKFNVTREYLENLRRAAGFQVDIATNPVIRGKIVELVGAKPDVVIAKMFNTSRSTVQKIRKAEGKPVCPRPKGKAGGAYNARYLAARERGYSSSLVEAAWAGNKLIEDLQATWTRSKALDKYIKELQCAF